jgi:hypothetical protein
LLLPQNKWRINGARLHFVLEDITAENGAWPHLFSKIDLTVKVFRDEARTGLAVTDLRN